MLRLDRNRGYSPGRSGFTIVEVVVSMALLGFTLIAVFGVLRACSTAAQHARMLTRSVLLAERLLAETRLSGNLVFETRKGQEGVYRWQVRLVPTPIESLGAIHVQVNWPEQQRQQQYGLFSLIEMRSFSENRG